MNFKEYQDKAVSTSIYPKEASIMYPLLGLLGEATEAIEKIIGDPWKMNQVKHDEEYTDSHTKIDMIADTFDRAIVLGKGAELLKKDIRKNGLGKDIMTKLEYNPEELNEAKKEIGDILWYIAATCRDLGIDMQEVAEMNITKLQSRKERGVIEGSGDNR